MKCLEFRITFLKSLQDVCNIYKWILLSINLVVIDNNNIYKMNVFVQRSVDHIIVRIISIYNIFV